MAKSHNVGTVRKLTRKSESFKHSKSERRWASSVTNIRASVSSTTPYNLTIFSCSIECMIAASFKNSIGFVCMRSRHKHLMATWIFWDNEKKIGKIFNKKHGKLVKEKVNLPFHCHLSRLPAAQFQTHQRPTVYWPILSRLGLCVYCLVSCWANWEPLLLLLRHLDSWASWKVEKNRFELNLRIN